MQNRQWEVKDRIGNGEAKELIYMTCEHELFWGNADRRRDGGHRGIKGRRGNCSSIINKYTLK